jgi:hypothetical protein
MWGAVIRDRKKKSKVNSLSRLSQKTFGEDPQQVATQNLL